MHIKCPACGAVASLDTLLAAEDGASEVVKIVGEMEPSLFKVIVPYLSLFRPKQSKLSWSRMASLLGELHPMIKNAQFERKGIVFTAPLSYWIDGIEQMVAKRDNLTLPLKNHGYLFEIMIGLDAKSVRQADKPKVDPVNQSPPPRAAHEPAEMPKDVMSKEEAMSVWKHFLGKNNSSFTQKTIEDPDEKRQQQLEELERRAEEKQQQEEPK